MELVRPIQVNETGSKRGLFLPGLLTSKLYKLERFTIVNMYILKLFIFIRFLRKSLV